MIPSPISVTLTWHEVRMAAEIGLIRQIQNLSNGRKDRFGCSPDEGWGPHIEGACGEMAVAKAFGIFWSGALGNLKADDVGKLQVRTRSKSHYELILHPDDYDDRPFVHVTGLAPEFVIVGWIIGRDGKRTEFWGDPAGGRPAFFVPVKVLRPLTELPL